PLTEVGVDVKAGDYMIAIDEQPVTTVNDLNQMLIGKADRIVQLTVNSTAGTTGSRKVLVKPIADETPLYYYNWVQNNIRKVSEATNGEVGYIHIPDMGPEGLNEFVKYYYPQLNKRALIIDDRGNGGGNVSPMIIERLRRELVIMSVARNGGPNTKPVGMMWGPKVLLLDRYSASDGDLFPYQFKTMKMGKTIGVRSWGGVVGIRGPIPFVDGGYLNRPEFAHYAADGSKFVIEGHGVDPDIVIDNDPYKEFMGQDDQLNRAIKEITEDLKNWPKQLPQAPAYPNKSK
ncbi:MAG: protease, partial [Bacteroidetes bacterium HGW-Bacteroidetes-22]